MHFAAAESTKVESMLAQRCALLCGLQRPAPTAPVAPRLPTAPRRAYRAHNCAVASAQPLAFAAATAAPPALSFTALLPWLASKGLREALVAPGEAGVVTLRQASPQTRGAVKHARSFALVALPVIPGTSCCAWLYLKTSYATYLLIRCQPGQLAEPAR